MKIIERLNTNRPIHYLHYLQPYFNPSQKAFRPNMSTHDILWLLCRVIHRSCYARGNPDIVMAVDLRKAFENVSQKVYLGELEKAYPSKRDKVGYESL